MRRLDIDKVGLSARNLGMFCGVGQKYSHGTHGWSGVNDQLVPSSRRLMFDAI